MRRFFFTRTLGLLGVALLLALGAVGLARAALIVDANGELLGADGVLVNGTAYDVRFVDGTCAEVFGVCDSAHFTFTTVDAAIAATTALLNDVFVDGAAGQFNSKPELTAGCELSPVGSCVAVTPYALLNLDVPSVFAHNSADPAADQLGGNNFATSDDFATSANEVWAVWTRSAPSPVPAPPSLWLAAAALGLMGLARQRARAAA